MHRLYGSIILFLLYLPVAGQVTFDQFPRDLQLYPRDASSQAEVIISGTVSTTGYTKVGAQMFREEALSRAVSQTVTATASNTTFRLAFTIKAEPAEYSFRFFLYKGADSTLVLERKRIVCGDAYIIHGQSNALALPDLDQVYPFTFNDKYIRTVAIPLNGPVGDIAWFPAKQPFGSVGVIGLRIQELILQNYKIPTCVLNGGVGGAPIDVLSARDPNNHANPNTAYGSLLYRAQWAGVAKQVKAIIWKQGEAESGMAKPDYTRKFATLYNQFREDYGDMRLYVGQINILDLPEDSAAALRDFQRRTKYLFKNVETIATVGTPGYGGVHYAGVANRQLGSEQYRLIARDIYGLTDTLQINSPDIKKAFYNARKDSITLVFDDQMQMVWKADTTFYSFATGAVQAYRQQKDYFYLDRQAGLIKSGLATSNRVILSLTQPVSAKTIRYLPAFFSDKGSDFYDGPTLRNTRGMRAFSFDNIPIADALPSVTTLAAKTVAEKQVQLTWNASATDQTQVLERADGTPTSFKRIATLAGNVATYTDMTLPDASGTYYYRIRVYNGVSESANSNIVSVKPVILGIEPIETLVSVYPNPLINDRLLHVTADQITFTNLSIRDMLGRTVKSWHGMVKHTLSILLTDLEAGVYVAELQTMDGYILRRKVVVR